MNIPKLGNEIEKILRTAREMVSTIESSKDPSIADNNGRDPRLGPDAPGQISIIVMQAANKKIGEAVERAFEDALETGVSDIAMSSGKLVF